MLYYDTLNKAHLIKLNAKNERFKILMKLSLQEVI